MMEQPEPLSNSEYFEQLIRRKTNTLSQTWIKSIILGILLFCLLMGIFGFYQVISTYTTQQKKSVIEELVPSNQQSNE